MDAGARVSCKAEHRRRLHLLYSLEGLRDHVTLWAVTVFYLSKPPRISSDALKTFSIPRPALMGDLVL